MRVVATGVHYARRLRTVWDIILFVNRQCIDIGANRNGASGRTTDKRSR